MKRFRRFKRRVCWGWADKGCVTIVGNQVNPASTARVILFPSGITENRFNGRTTIQRIVLWLDAWYTNTTNVAQQVPGFDLYLIRTERSSGESAISTTSLSFSPFLSPSTPATITSWSDDDSGRGLDDYLWTGHSFANPGLTSQVGANFAATSDDCGNSSLSQGTGALKYYANDVRAWLHPTLDLRVKRRMLTGDELVFGVTADRGLTSQGTDGTGPEKLSVRYAVRILTTK